MSHQSSLIADDILAYLDQHENKALLRFITCGSVDDGKSTLIGRLLHDSKMIYEDHLAAIHADTERYGTTEDGPDLALLVDGLQAEREQGITIDVAYRYFSTEKRKFIIADTPGHEQYTRNMATGASTAQLAVILVDATKGVLPQTKRHSALVSLLGIRRLIVAINKMDLAGFDEARFRELEASYRAFLRRLEDQLGGEHEVAFVPMSALQGDNVVGLSEATPWYAATGGRSLMTLLEETPIEDRLRLQHLRFPVQFVNRPDHSFRGYCGTVASGRVAVGDDVMALPSRVRSRVARVVTFDGDRAEADAGEAVTLTLEDDVDVGRGDLLVHPKDAPSVGSSFEARIVWMHEEALEPGRQYAIKLGTSMATGVIERVQHRLDVQTLDEVATDRLALNEIGLCDVQLTTSVAFDAYAMLPVTGSFIVIDRTTNVTVGAGMIVRASRVAERDKATNVVWQETRVDKAQRSALKKQRPAVVWFTGLSGAGKSTIANALEHRLATTGHHTYLLDGDNVRHGLNRDLGFSDQDRVENIRRIGEVAKLFVDAGLIVITAFISPFRSDRRLVRELLDEGEFIEVFVDTPLEVAEARDPKGLYARARRGEIKNFTGIDSPYERPHDPEVHLHTVELGLEEQVDAIMRALEAV